MKNIHLKVENGDLIGILVPVGDGKTCLLNSKLNNLDVVNNQSDKKINLWSNCLRKYENFIK